MWIWKAGGLVIGLVLLTGGSVGASLAAPSPDRGDWDLIGQLGNARSGHTSTLLTDGTILVVGGEGTRSAPVLAAELVYPESGASRPAGTLPWGTVGHRAVALPDGRVLVTSSDGVAGGSFSSGNERCAAFPPLTWDPATLSFTPVPGVVDAYGASATLLEDGRVLFAGGGTECDRDGGRSGLDRALVWDPGSGEVAPTGSLIEPRAQHSAVRLDDGRVLVGGGQVLEFGSDYGGMGTVTSLEIWDPATGSWQPAGQSGLTGADLTLLPDGRIAVIGTPGDGDDGLLVWDPASGMLGPASAALPPTRIQGATTMLDDGRLALIGGLAGPRYDERPAASADLWDPVLDIWEAIEYPRAGADIGHTATTLPDGTIIVIGGRQMHGDDHAVESIEAWAP